MDMARAVVHAVMGWKAKPFGLLAEERHLVVEDAAGIAGCAAACACCRETRTLERLGARSDGRQRDQSPAVGRQHAPSPLCRDGAWFHLVDPEDWLEIDLDQFVGEFLLLEERQQRRIAVDRALVEVAAD